MFPMGQVVQTCGVADYDDEGFAGFVQESLQRHSAGDWGDLSPDDKKANQQALRDGSRLLSAYEKDGMPKIWIITEWNRSVTTILFPDEY